MATQEQGCSEGQREEEERHYKRLGKKITATTKGEIFFTFEVEQENKDKEKITEDAVCGQQIENNQFVYSGTTIPFTMLTCLNRPFSQRS